MGNTKFLQAIVLMITLFSLSFAQAEIVLKYWRHHQESEYQGMKELIAQFEKKNPGVTIRLQTLPYKTFVNKLAATLATGTGPDMINIHNSWAYSYIKNNLLQQMPKELYSKKELDEEFFGVVRAFSDNDKQYCVPVGGGNLALFYNKDHFREVGLDPNRPPKNWEEFVDYAKKLTKWDKYGRLLRSGVALGGKEEQSWNYLIDSVFPQMGVKHLSKDQKSVSWNTEDGAKALKWYTDFCRKHKVFNHSFPKPSDAFKLKLASMYVTGPFTIGFLRRDAPDIDFGIAPLPSHKYAATASSLWGTCITKKVSGEALKIASKFIKYITSMKSMKLWTSRVGEIPVRKAMLNDKKFIARYPDLQAFIYQMPYATASLKKNETRYKYYITRAIERVIIQDVDPKKALEEASLHINKMLETN